MILQCPDCNARYAVPDHAIGANGRTVRCKKCLHEWFANAPQAADVAALEALLKVPEEPVLKTIPTGARVPKPIAPPSPILTAAVAAVALLALITTLFTYKPGWFGYPKTSGIVLADLSLAKQEIERGMEYAVSGKLVNTSNEIITPPKVRITLVDKEGSMLQYWEPVMPESVEANEALPFTFGPLTTKFSRGDRLVVELGNTLELALRRKP